MIPVGLRIDVDTLRGARIGVPNLTTLLERCHIRGTFFFSVGPDNMGRHLWRLMRPTFLVKMLRTRAANLYGWDILMRGTLWPGPVIGEKASVPIQDAARAGHEIGLHAWDHHRWQTHIERMDKHAAVREIRRGYDLLTGIIGRPPDCAAAPAWRTTPAALEALAQFPFRFNSDCRGHSIFFPVVDGLRINQPQVPTTLPTYDEVIGLKSTPKTYNQYMLDLIRPGYINVLTIHAEAEGISYLPLFQDFLDKALRSSILFTPLGDILAETKAIEESGIHRGGVDGRQGWLTLQDGTTV